MLIGLLFAVIVVGRTFLRYRNVKASKSIFDGGETEEYASKCKELGQTVGGASRFREAAKSLFKTYTDAITEMEAKAGRILGFVGGGTSVIAILGIANQDKVHFSPLLIFALALFPLVLLSALGALYPIVRQAPDVAHLARLDNLEDLVSDAYVNLWMGGQYVEAARQCSPIVVKKSYLVRAALALFAIAVISLLSNSFIESYGAWPQNNSQQAHHH
jgi:hypothetical protein